MKRDQVKSYLAKRIEEKRSQLYTLLEDGKKEDILASSQELDLLINEYNKNLITESISC